MARLITLRSNKRGLHDGTPVTSDDVIFTTDMMTQAVVSTGYQDLCSKIEVTKLNTRI
jgi:hypothetical protein